MSSQAHARTDRELAINIQKATNPDETAPKRKHVRSCIVYTWDHKSSLAFWNGIKVQPVLADEVQTFKALITMHKVLQEGHPIALKEAMPHRGWIESLSRGSEGMRGYGPLIHEYVRFLLAKLAFHHQHPTFNGTFDYEEYVSLKLIQDPNEGYETISDLMSLQDRIDSFQKLIFAHFRHSANECRISALVPLVQESYGIYCFVTSMLRAMHQTIGEDGALAPLRERYDAEHYRLVKFYYECSNLRYLTSLITVPKLPSEPPNLLADEGTAPALPARPKQEIERAPSPPPPPRSDEPDEMDEFWSNELDNQNEEYAAQQRVLHERAAQKALEQQQAAQLAQQAFEEQQRQLAEKQRREQEALAAQHAQWQTQGRMAELERENLNARAQYQQDQLLLQQFDARVKALEAEIVQQQANHGTQSGAKDDQIRALQEQVNTWRSKYDALAKLYAQLRHEHLDLLQKYKTAHLKAASAHEAIERREKLERELKTKNLELADMIRERDRAFHERDRLKGANTEEIERLKRELLLTQEKLEDADITKGTQLSYIIAKYHRELADVREGLRLRQVAVEQTRDKLRDVTADMERKLQAKDDELAVYKTGMDQALEQLAVLKEAQSADHTIDTLLVGKLDDVIDAVLDAAATRVDDSLYELDSTLHAGNPSALPPYLLSQIEKASASATECATSFNNYIADGPNTAPAGLSDLTKNISTVASAVADLVPSVKGIARRTTDDDTLVNAARDAAQAAARFFRNLQSWRLEGLDAIQKTDVVINGNNDVQLTLQALNKLVDVLPRGFTLDNSDGDPGAIVDKELAKAADAVQAAVARLAALRRKPRDALAAYKVEVHEAILDAAGAVTSAVAELVRAATAAQNDIVQAGRGEQSTTAFYKKNNRWTEGLISAAKAVAASTNTLIETADGVLSGRNSPEQLIVASNDVAASTAQLVAASRVRAVGGLASRTQEALEVASKAVGAACRSLVRQVQALLKPESDDDAVDYAKLGSHEFKVREMEQQVEILQLENSLSAARRRLGEMRKISYQEE